MCRGGEPVEMRPEPKNPADPNAVAVFSARCVQIGYLTAERAPWIGSMLKRGRPVAAIFQQQTQWGAWIRVAFDGERPVLPDLGDRDNAEFDADDHFPKFEADPEWPD